MTRRLNFMAPSLAVAAACLLTGVPRANGNELLDRMLTGIGGSAYQKDDCGKSGCGAHQKHSGLALQKGGTALQKGGVQRSTVHQKSAHGKGKTRSALFTFDLKSLFQHGKSKGKSGAKGGTGDVIYGGNYFEAPTPPAPSVPALPDPPDVGGSAA